MKLSTADAVVIGGGIIGTSIAYYLAKMGLKVELVERRGIAAGTSSACADALVLQTKAPGPKLTMAMESVGIYRGLSEELDCDLEFRNEGGMVIALNQAELEYVQGLVARLRASGVPVELLDNKAAREIQPALIPKLLAASYCALDCHLNPLRVSPGFARAAQRLGAGIRTRTEVTGIDVQNGRVTGVLTSLGRIDTPIAINAAGIWAPAIAQMVGVELAVAPRRGQLLVTEALPVVVKGRVFGARYLMGKLKKLGSDGGATGDSYSSGMAVGQQPHGNFIIGATREFVGEDTSTTHEAIMDLARQTVELFPILHKVQVIRVFSGLRPAAIEGVPTIRRYSEPEGFIVAAGHEGDGICLSPITGKIVAEIVAGRIDDYHQYGPLAEQHHN